MIRFVTDEDFDNRILRGLLRRRSDLDSVRLQDTHLTGADDPTILEWADQQRRILLTHDISTMTRYGYERIHYPTKDLVSTKFKESVELGQNSRPLISQFIK